MSPHGQELNLTLKSSFFFYWTRHHSNHKMQCPQMRRKDQRTKYAVQRDSEHGRAEGPTDGGGGHCGNGVQVSKPEKDGREEMVMYLLLLGDPRESLGVQRSW